MPHQTVSTDCILYRAFESHFPGYTSVEDILLYIQQFGSRLIGV